MFSLEVQAVIAWEPTIKAGTVLTSTKATDRPGIALLFRVTRDQNESTGQFEEINRPESLTFAFPANLFVANVGAYRPI